MLHRHLYPVCSMCTPQVTSCDSCLAACVSYSRHPVCPPCVSQVTSCDSCPAGFECAAKDQPPTVCGLGTYSQGGLAACLACPDGQACPDPAAAPVNCAAGYYSPSVSLAH